MALPKERHFFVTTKQTKQPHEDSPLAKEGTDFSGTLKAGVINTAHKLSNRMLCLLNR